MRKIPSIAPVEASNRPLLPHLNPYLTPGRPILKTSTTSSSSISSISTASTIDSTFSIRSFTHDLSPSTPPNDLEESINQRRTTRSRNLYISPTRAPRKLGNTSQAAYFLSEIDGDQGGNDDDQDEVKLKIPGAFPEGNFIHTRRNLDLDNATNSTPVHYPMLPAAVSQRPKFTPYGSSHKSSQEIKHSIRSLLQKPLEPHYNLTPGYIYAFKSPIYAPSHIKIGQTSRAPETRMREWSKCGIPISEVCGSTSLIASKSSNISSKDAFYHYNLVESIIFEEFHNQRKWFECEICKNNQRGPRRHIEWLKINASTATHAINRWRTWLEREKPFTSSGKLTDYWQWGVDELPKRSSNIDWDDWTSPGSWEYWAFRLEQFPLYTSKLNPHIMRKEKQFWTMGCFFVFAV
ncbi:hypothetical protein NHQ30_004790 [Ciborinia camelliae]|nr:hypothetical protein NHQ30_004790 [Ciborinia camelliae]